MNHSHKRSIVERLIRVFTGKPDPHSDVFAHRKPTPEEIRIIEFLKKFAPPITRTLLAARESGHTIQGPRLGYHTLKGTGGDLYPGHYALAIENDDPHGFKSGRNRFFCFEWEIEGLGYLYVLPVINEKRELAAVDYVTRGSTFIHGANVMRRERQPNHSAVEADLRKSVDLWERHGDRWRTAYARASRANG